MSENPVIPQTSFLVCGPHSSGKTLLAAQLADYVEKRSGGKMITRLYTADKGGFDNLQSRIDKSTLQVHNAVGCEHPFEHLEQCAKGGWNDEKGEWKPPTQKTWETVGARVIEGLLSFSTALKQGLTDQVESGRIHVDPEAASKYDRPPVYFDDGNTHVRGLPTGKYGTLYTRLEHFCSLSMGFPGITVWTSQEKEVEDSRNIPIAIGPAVEGLKLIPIVPSWFRHTVYLDSSNKKRTPAGGAEDEYRVYIKSHNHPQMPTVGYIGKLRLGDEINPCDVPRYIVNDPMGVFNPGKPTPNVFDTIFNLLQGQLPAAKK